ncbi:MAG: adenosylcobinamide-phosphate synthase CbiB [Pseudomonas marincola]
MSDLANKIVDHAFDPSFIVFAVFAADMLIGDPKLIYRFIPHPVIPIGNFIGWLAKILNNPAYSNLLRFLLGVKTTSIVIFLCIAVGVAIETGLKQVPGGIAVYILISSSLIAYQGLYRGVNAVAQGLDRSLEDGRIAVSHIVGRDPASLDEAGAARAAIESLAENFSDGTVAPLFWFAIFGLPGLLFYKAVNTLDSMIGHRNETYEYFGKFAARLDDVVNYIPARLTGIVICVASFKISAVKAMIRDAKGHKSVNAGWQEAAMAGALDIALAGPRQYAGKMTEDIWMNSGGRQDVSADDIRSALRLYVKSGAVLMICCAGFAALHLI